LQVQFASDLSRFHSSYIEQVEINCETVFLLFFNLTLFYLETDIWLKYRFQNWYWLFSILYHAFLKRLFIRAMC